MQHALAMTWWAVKSAAAYAFAFITQDPDLLSEKPTRAAPAPPTDQLR